MSSTYYSAYGSVSSRYFSSPDETVQSVHFSSPYGTGSYTRPTLTEYLCFTTNVRGECAFHGIGFTGEDGFPISYKPSDTELTSRLSNRVYETLTKANESGASRPHFLSSSIFVTQDDSLVMASSSNKPEAYLYSPSSKTTNNHLIEFLSFSSPTKVQGVASESGEDCYVVFDDANDVSFLYRREIVGESSESSA